MQRIGQSNPIYVTDLELKNKSLEQNYQLGVFPKLENPNW
jgi:hypothetical protein